MTFDRSPAPEDEPFGHTGYYSKIERAWMRMPWGTRLERRRTARFDSVSSILYEPVEYEYPFIGDYLQYEQAETSSIRQDFLDFVRGEFRSGDAARAKPAKFRPQFTEERTAGLQALGEYLSNCESDFVYNGLVDNLVGKYGDDMVRLIYEVLCSPDLGHRRNRSNVDLEAFRGQLQAQIEQRSRLMFLLPSFPFKDQNRFRTYSGASTVDMAEISLLARLHTLALALYQVHPFGADIVVLSDGQLYAPVFGVDDAQARRYREQLRGFRNLLNIQGTVSILDLSEIAAHLRPTATSKSSLDQYVDSVREVVQSFEHQTDELGEAFAVLKRGMKWNFNTRELLANLSDSDAWEVLTEMRPDAVSSDLKPVWEEVDAASSKSAASYAAFNLAFKKFDLLGQLFPGALRATVHPKSGQFAVPQMGTVYPWNGVGFLETGRLGSGDVASVPLHELAGTSLAVVRLDMTGEPLYFERQLWFRQSSWLPRLSA